MLNGLSFPHVSQDASRESSSRKGFIGSRWSLAQRRLAWPVRPAMVIVTVGLCAGQAAVAQAAIIVAYDGANSTGSAPATLVGPGVTPLDLNRGGGLNDATGATYNSSGWTDEPTDYLEWGWSASSPIDLTDLDLRYDRSGSGPTSVDIQLSVNGGAFQSVFVDNSVSDTGEEALDIDLSSFTNVSSAVFRLFGSGASSGTGTFDIEPLSGVVPDQGIVVNGIVAVPEPSALGLASLAVVPLMIRRRRTAARGCLRTS